MSERPGYVYRAFNAEGTLLYIGATLMPGRRFSTHQSQTEWWGEVQTISVEQHPSKVHALAAEGHAIETEAALYNVMGPRGVLDPDEFFRRRIEREAQRKVEARKRYFTTTYHANGTILCTNCGRYPQRMPKGSKLADLVCKKCRCATLVRTDSVASDSAAVRTEKAA